MKGLSVVELWKTDGPAPEKFPTIAERSR